MDAKLEAFRDLCRKASIETDPAELESLKDALRFMLHSEEIELHAVNRVACCGKETLKTELKPSVMTDVRQRT